MAQSKYDPVPYLLEAVSRALERPPSQYSKYDVLQARELASHLLNIRSDPATCPCVVQVATVCEGLVARMAFCVPL